MDEGLKIAFAGTPDLAAHILNRIVENGAHNIFRIYTQPDRPAGRGKILQQSPVKQLAKGIDLPVVQPLTTSDVDPDNLLNEMDVLIVAAFGMILTEDILVRPRYGCINIHTSLLPRWRGAAPIQHAIMAGDKKTGITIMQMDTGLDTGNILFQKECPIDDTESSASLHEKLAKLGGECIITVLDMIMKNSVHPIPQQDSLATYAKKITKADAKIDWTKPICEIDRLIRAMNPTPTAYSVLNNTTIRIWRAVILENNMHNMTPGRIVNYSNDGLDISSSDGILRILDLQLPGKKIMTCRNFYNGHPTFFINSDNP